MNQQTHNPHDKFARASLNNIHLAKRFFRLYLPDEVRDCIDLDTLVLQKSSHLDAVMNEHISDMVYKVECAGRASYIYVLLEHQSTVDHLMAFRILAYTVQIMQRHLRTYKSRKLPLVYPMVYYAGSEPSGGFEQDIYNCFEHPDLARKLFMQPFALMDLQQFSDAELAKDKVLAGLNLMQKHIRDPDLSGTFDYMFEQGIFREVYDYDQRFYQHMLYYGLDAGEVAEPAEFLQRLSKTVPEEEEKIMTIAQSLRQEGVHETTLKHAKMLVKHEGYSIQRAATLFKLDVEKLRAFCT
jgi:predicted transposase/invertase (TIGR01784 family)